MTAWHELVVDAPEVAVRAFVVGFLAGRGESEAAVVFGSDVDIEPASLGERLKELLLAGSHRVVLAPAPLAGPLAQALESRGRAAGVVLERARVIRTASFTFRAEVFRRPFADQLRAALGTRPETVAVGDLDEHEETHPEAAGVELYAPLHQYVYRASGRIEGPFPGVLEMYRRLRDMDFVEIGRLHLNG